MFDVRVVCRPVQEERSLYQGSWLPLFLLRRAAGGVSRARRPAPSAQRSSSWLQSAPVSNENRCSASAQCAQRPAVNLFHSDSGYSAPPSSLHACGHEPAAITTLRPQEHYPKSCPAFPKEANYISKLPEGFCKKGLMKNINK